ncbi:MAG TPA: hypothetical protein DIW46_08365 [Microbacterium sp.]|nr:hypothetical protein [Microbacterium sp.]
MSVSVDRPSGRKPPVIEAQEALRTRDFVDVPTLAAAMEQSIHVIREAIARGDIKVVRLGRSIRIPTKPLRRAWGLE